MMTDLNITQQEVARRLGKSRPYIANMLRLLQLPKNVAQMVQHGVLSSAHGRTLLTLKDASKIKRAKSCSGVLECKVFRGVCQWFSQ